MADAENVLKALLNDDASIRAEWERSQKLIKDPRVTRVGRLLRESSLDELPQLINVVRGEMSLVGPRPIVPSETSRYGDRLDSYVLARPGLTGAWQISGRSDCGYDKRVKLDANYVTDSPSTYFLGPRPSHAEAKVSCESRQGFCRLSGANRRNEKGQPQEWPGFTPRKNAVTVTPYT